MIEPRLRPLVLALGFVLVTQPFQASLIPRFYLVCVVALGRKDLIRTPPLPPGTPLQPPLYGPWIPEASGFLYGKFLKKEDEQHSTYGVYLVTNRHVVEEHDQLAKGGPLWVRFNQTTAGSAREYDIPMRDDQGKLQWHFHPNPSVDIAILKINPAFLKAQGARFDFFRSEDEYLSLAKAKELGLSEGDSVYVMGFPMGLVGQREDYVIVRQGSIARVRDVLDSSLPGTFLVDSFIFPGNSGGPVILRPEMFSVQGQQSINKAYLLGVVRSYLPLYRHR